MDPTHEELRDALRPFRPHVYATLGSTNDEAARLRRAGDLFAPAAVLTFSQTAGRGRGANAWHAPAGAVTVTFALPAGGAMPVHQVPLVAGVAVRRAVLNLGLSSDLKWPNDLQHDGLKLAGLLCERLAGVDLIGIGLNLNVDPADLPPEVRRRATSLYAATGRRTDVAAALAALATHLAALLLRPDEVTFASVREEYSRHHALTGRRVRVGEVDGTCEGIDPDGRLLVRDGGSLHRLTVGTVHAD